MIQLPIFLKSFRRHAKECLAEGLVKETEFSRGTYQISVIDPSSKKEEWVFLQFDPQGRLKDSFCTCKSSENNHGCIHQAIAFFHVYDSHNKPLHLRFERSLWNQLCYQCAQIPAKDLIEVESGLYIVQNSKKKTLFSIHATTEAAKIHLKKIIFEKPIETEETSIKFSNRSPEELALWHNGRYSPQLSYELSFWYDLAKWLLTLQESKTHYKVTFDYLTTSKAAANKKLPTSIKIAFPELIMEQVFNAEQLIPLIPTLKTVKSPLAIHYISNAETNTITYDKTNLRFVFNKPSPVHESIDSKKSQTQKKTAGKELSIGDWIYIENDGFYSKKSQSLPSHEEWSDVEFILNNHLDLLKSLLVDCTICETPTPIAYELKFDSKNYLHINEFLLSPGDLLLKESHIFGSWAYISDHGFYRIEGSHLDQITTIIPDTKVADFVSLNRSWLNTQPQFSTHVIPISTNLDYALTDDNTLTFTNRTDRISQKNENIDFGQWIYVPDQGFYTKTSAQLQTTISADTIILSDQVPVFIRRNFNELQLIDGFFSQHCPISKAQLNISISSSNQIEINPIYEVLPTYANKNVRFFDNFTYVDGEGFYELSPHMKLPEAFSHSTVIEDAKIDSFINHDLQTLLPFTAFLDPRLQKIQTKHLIVQHIDASEDQIKSQCALKLAYQSELGTISLFSLWTALRDSKQYVFSDAGLIDLSEKQFGWIKTLEKRNINLRDKTLLLSPLELLRLNAFDHINIPEDDNATNKKTLTKLQDLLDFRLPEPPDISGLLSHLRPYQHTGLEWLWFLYHHGLSGLLCDDMGLGKTHQAMALITACTNYWRQKNSTERHHYVIVCPTSVIYHWQEKLKKFLPELRVWTFHGINRSIETFYEESDILLTSYGIWRNETKILSKMLFDVAIFDEIQIAKNQSSLIYNSLLKVNARMKLGMTGTPIENRLRELKALFDLVLPSYMPSDQEYKKNFINPIEKHANPEKKELLAKLIKPFVLRRKKEDVLFDLPEKTEELSYCDLLPTQIQLYTTILSSSKDKILNNLIDTSLPIPYIHIFALLAHLKQICNHPAAYLKKPEEYKEYESGKWNLFVELLEEARESGQKIVVFSQYLTMLDIIELYLKENKIGYATIRGSTINRGEQVERFNTNPNCEVFVASLQAAGLGIDLTGASVVIHYDRWWNAARERQATDRVHRIGQTRGVQVFKLTTKGSIEEHIDLMISKKGQLLEDVVGIDNHQVIKKFDRQEIMELLQIIPS